GVIGGAIRVLLVVVGVFWVSPGLATRKFGLTWRVDWPPAEIAEGKKIWNVAGSVVGATVKFAGSMFPAGPVRLRMFVVSNAAGELAKVTRTLSVPGIRAGAKVG